MNDLEQEEYVFLRYSTSLIEDALRAIELIKTTQDPHIVGILIKYAVITYCSPFTTNKAVFKQEGHMLDLTFVPDERLEFHKKLMNHRSNRFAHTNLEMRKPHLSKLGNWYAISFKGFYHEELLALVEPLTQLAKEVHERVMVKLQETEDRWDAQPT